MDIDLKQRAAGYGLNLSSQHLELLDKYLHELQAWNKHMNLTGIRSRERIINELVLDSLIAASVLPQRARMLDVGSGAGFPGIPIKIYRPQIDISLLEANSKKIHFLKHIIRQLRLTKIETIHGRIENAKHTLHPRGYHIISARALTNIVQVFEWCASYLLPNGLLVTFLGRQAEMDLQQHECVMKRWSLIPDKIIPYVLPGKNIKRSVVFLKKRE